MLGGVQRAEEIAADRRHQLIRRHEPERAGDEVPRGQVERDRVEAPLLGQAAPLVGDDLIGHLDLAVAELDPAALLRPGQRAQDARLGLAPRLRVPRPVEGRDQRDAIVQIERLGEIGLAAVQVDRALVHGRVGPLLLEHPEQGAGRPLDDGDRVGRARAQRDAARGRSRAAPGQSARRADELAGLHQLFGRPQRTGAEHVVIRLGQRQLVRRRAQVPDADLGIRRIEDGRFVRAPQERVGMVDEVAVERVGAGDQQREALAAPPGAPPLLAQARDGAGESDGERAVEQADVHAELERLGRHHAQQPPRDQIALDAPPLLGRVARAIRRQTLGHVVAPRRDETLAREAEDELARLAALDEADGAQSARGQGGQETGGLAQRRATRPLRLVEQRRVPERHAARRARRAVVLDDAHVETREQLAGLRGIRDRRAREQELRLAAVQRADPPQPAQHERDVRAEDAAVGVRLVDRRRA